MTLTDKDVRGGDESISSLNVVVTPESLAERESSVLWHRLFSQVYILSSVSTPILTGKRETEVTCGTKCLFLFVRVKWESYANECWRVSSSLCDVSGIHAFSFVVLSLNTQIEKALSRRDAMFNRGEIADSSVSAVVGFRLIWSRLVSAA